MAEVVDAPRCGQGGRMGCDVWAVGGKAGDAVELNWSSAAYGLLSLTARWTVPSRDCDDCHDQHRIDASAISALHAEAPTGMPQFREYCIKILGDRHAAELDDDDLVAIRDFVTKTHEIGDGAGCSY